MCGIAGLIALDQTEHPRGAATDARRRHGRHARAPRPGRLRRLGVRRWPRGARAAPALDHRPVAARPQPDALGWRPPLDHLQRRDLQLPRRSAPSWSSAGCRFRSQTDTEVILAAYDRWGVDCVQRLAGMFAFALWDAPRRRLWLVRDRLGKKPLYYAESRRPLYVRLGAEGDPGGSDVSRARSIRRRSGIVPALRVRAVAVDVFRAARESCRRRITLDLRERPRDASRATGIRLRGRDASGRVDDHEAEEALDARLATAVRQRDDCRRPARRVPVGRHRLVAGRRPDAASSAAYAGSHLHDPIRPTRTSTKPTTRRPSRGTSGTDHARADLRRPTDARRRRSTCPAMFDEPFADSSAIPTYLVSQIARQSRDRRAVGRRRRRAVLRLSAIPLSRGRPPAALKLPPADSPRRGLGAALDMPTRRLRRIADVLRSDERGSGTRASSRWWTPRRGRDADGRVAGRRAAVRRALARAFDVAGEAQPGLLDLVSYLPEDILTKVDRASMAVSLEVRAPLLDHRVVEFALGLPLSAKYRGRSTKWLLRRMLYKRVPRELVERPKMGFGVPLERLVHGAAARADDGLLRRDGPRELRHRSRAGARAVARLSRPGASHRTDLLWQMFMLVAWARRLRSAPAALAPVTAA